MKLFLLIFCSLLYACDSSKAPAPEKRSAQTEQAKSFNTKVVKIATEEYAPFIASSLHKNGFLAQVITEAFKLEGISTKFDFLPAARSYQSAKSGKYDATVPWAKREERLNDFYFGEPILESDVEVFFYLDGQEFEWDPEKQDYSLLKGKVIGAINGANYGKKFMNAEKTGLINVDRVTHSYQNLRKLASKRIDLMITPKTIALHELKKEKEEYKALKAVKVIQAIKEPVEYDYLIISKNSPNGEIFNNAFNKGMKKLKESGRYKELLEEFQKSLLD